MARLLLLPAEAAALRDEIATVLLRPATASFSTQVESGQTWAGAERFWQAGRWCRAWPEDDEFSRWSGGPRLHYAVDGDPPNEPNGTFPHGLRNGAFAAAAPDELWRLRPARDLPAAAARFHLELLDATCDALDATLARDPTCATLGVRPAPGGGFLWGPRPRPTARDAYVRRWGARFGPTDGAHVWRLVLRVHRQPAPSFPFHDESE